MEKKLNYLLDKNVTSTRLVCKDLLHDLKKRHLDPVLRRLQGEAGAKVSFDDVTGAYSRIEHDYEKAAKGAKDAIAAVFLEFHPVRKYVKV